MEYQVAGISQIQVRPQIGLTFANGLRSIVRQDPDMIMVGEIRDHETAEIAIHAALTGHLVFSTTAHQRRARMRSRACWTWESSRIWWRRRWSARSHSAWCGASAQFCAVSRSMPDRPSRWKRSASPRRTGPASAAVPAGTRLRQVPANRLQRDGSALYELFVVDETIRRMTVDRSGSSTMKEHAMPC